MADTDIKQLGLTDLICEIQPLWNKYNMGHGADKMSQKEIDHMMECLKEYKDRGCDMEYFTAGAGAPGNCILC